MKNSSSLFNFRYLLFTILILISSCKNKPAKQLTETDTVTSGELILSADESFAPLVKDEVSIFQAIYPKTKIQVQFKSEGEAVDDLLKKRVHEIIIPRQLSHDELSYFTEDYPPRQIRIGADAVVFIVNKQNPDSNLRYDEVLNILRGKIADWNEVRDLSSRGKISIIFDNTRSSVFNYLEHDVLKGDSISSQAFAVDSNAAVISYVEKNSSAIGVIGASWISALGDTVAKNFLSRISLVGISGSDSLSITREIFYRPTHAALLQRQYPFLRDLYIISTEEYMGLGTGFATYVASDEGQTVVKRSGLIPAKEPQRVIQITNQF